jgi:uncharacterized protein YwqG
MQKNDIFFPTFEDAQILSEMENLPLHAINTLSEVLKSYEALENRMVLSKLYKNRIVIELRGEKVGICIVSIGPDGSILSTNKWSINSEDCPVSFIRQLNKDKGKLIEGYPAAVIDFPKEVRDYIMERSRSGGSGVKNKLLHWIRSWIK